MICCCSMAGTKSCKTCSNNPNSKGTLYPYYPYLDNSNVTFTYDGTHTYSYPAKKKINKPIVQYWCPNCEASIEKSDKFCHNCGSELDWSDLTD